MQQGFYVLLDHSTGEKFLNKCSEDINVCTLQRATDKVALDLYAGKRQDKLCKDDHQTGWHGSAPNDEQYAQAMADLDKIGESLK